MSERLRINIDFEQVFFSSFLAGGSGGTYVRSIYRQTVLETLVNAFYNIPCKCSLSSI